MKKRILAFALACLMLVSMIPMTALAADVKCPGAGVAHGEECVAIGTFLKEVKAEGCEEGYKLYSCNTCGTAFMTDITPASHVWVEQKDVAATCHSDGKDEYSICSKCNKEKFVTIKKETVAHDFANGTPTGEYVNEKPVIKCKNCTVTNKEEGGRNCSKLEGGTHTWAGVTPVIKTAPTATAEGLAVFTCSECKYSEEVVIHNHNLTKHNKVDPFCVNDGTKEYYSCSICNKNYLTLDDAKVFKACKDSDLVIDGAADHDWEAGNIKNYVAANCGDGTPNTYDQWCKKCEKYVSRRFDATHTFGYKVEIDATCMNKGAHYNVCNACGANYAIDNKTPMESPVNTTGHNAYKADDHKSKPLDVLYSYLLAYNEWTVEKVTGGVDNKPTCTQSCVVTIKCGKCNVTKEITIDALNHSYETKTVAATCGTYAFTYKVCTNANCPLMVTGLNTEVATKSGDAVTGVYKDNNSDAVGVEYVLDPSVKYISGSVTVNKTAGFNASNHKVEVTIVTPATCTEQGKKTDSCMFCSAYGDTTVFYGPLQHKWPVAGVDADKTYIQHVVKDCNDVAGELYTEYDVYTCKNDGTHTEIRNKVVHTAPAQYNSLAEAQKYHKIEGVTPTRLRPADCKTGTYSLDVYVCTGCKEDIVVANIESANHTTPDNYAGKQNATCTTDAKWPAYTCKICSTAVAEVVLTGTKLNHDFKKAADAKAVGCTTDGALQIDKCSRCDVHKVNGKEYASRTLADAAAKINMKHKTEANFTKVNAKAPTCTADGNVAYWHCNVCNKNWTPVVGTTTEIKNVVTGAEKTGHDFDDGSVVRSVSASCENKTFGYIHYNCTNTNCDEQYIVNYEAPVHAKGEIIKDKKLDPTCTAAGYQMYKCANTAGCEYREDLVALGHVNKDGVNLSLCANNDVKDRKCTRTTGCVLAGADAPAVAHQNVPVTVKATCTAEGYTASVCKECNKIDDTVEIKIEKALGHDIVGSSYWKVENKVTLTPTADKVGTWVKACSRCDYEEPGERSGVAFTMATSNATKAGAAYTDATLVKVTVSLSGLPTTTVVGGVQFNITHSANVVFSHCEAAGTTFDFANAAVNTTLANTVTVTLLSADGVALGTNTAAVDVYFVVNSKVAADVTFTIDDDTATATDTTAKADYWVAPASGKTYAAQATLKTVALLNLNGDAEIDAKDLVLLYSYAKSADGAYDSAADIDRDGEVTYKDLALLNNYITNPTADAYDKLVGRYVEPTPAP